VNGGFAGLAGKTNHGNNGLNWQGASQKPKIRTIKIKARQRQAKGRAKST
jgi:hypothetical protein